MTVQLQSAESVSCWRFCCEWWEKKKEWKEWDFDNDSEEWWEKREERREEKWKQKWIEW